MAVDKVLVSGEQSVKYNGLAWTLGYSDRWIWPWGHKAVTQEDFERFYREHGNYPIPVGKLSGLGTDEGGLKHGSISGPGYGSRWESKCGQWLRIRHDLEEMEDGTYGKIRGYFAKKRAARAADGGGKSKRARKELSRPFTEEERKLVKERAAEVPEEIGEGFKSAYEPWKKSWDDPVVAMSSIPLDRAKFWEFADLIALGLGVLPLVMEKMVGDPDQFFALQIVDNLAKDELMVEWDPADPVVLEGEQARVKATVRRWLSKTFSC